MLIPVEHDAHSETGEIHCKTGPLWAPSLELIHLYVLNTAVCTLCITEVAGDVYS